MAKCGCSGSSCNCVVQAGTGTTVTGAGSAANPYIVSAIGDDTVVTVSDTPTVNNTLTGDGSPGTPYNISSAVIVDPVAGNTLVAGPAGLSVPCESIQDCVGQGFDDGLIYDDALNQYRVRLSTDGGNTLTFGTDSGVYNPASPVDIGCGLANGPGGEVIVDTSGTFAGLTRRVCDDDEDTGATVPIAGPDTSGMEIYCAADGSLRTKPEKFTDVQTVGANQAHAPALTVFPASSAIIQLTVTNPSPVYCMCGYAVFALITSGVFAPGTVIRVLQDKDLGDGGGFTLTTGYTVDSRGLASNAGSGQHRIALPIPICLDPGETKILQHRVTYQRDPANDNGGAASITATAHEIYWVGTNL